MRAISLLAVLLVSLPSLAQYYYQDVMGTREINNRMKTYLQARVQSITATGFDERKIKSSDYNEWQEIQSSGSILKITTRNGQHIGRVYYHFDNETKLNQVRDSSGHLEIITTYTYDDKKNLTAIRTAITDSLQDFAKTEEHRWHYNEAGKPEKLLRIINNKDTTEYRFTLDESGNVADERLYRRGVGIDPVYYYYDEKNRLTDIVRFNKKAGQLLPDIMFEYDDNDRIIQRITTVSLKNPDYLIWRYLFNDKGLKTKEALYNKQKQLSGSIEYQYSFSQ